MDILFVTPRLFSQDTNELTTSVTMLAKCLSLSGHHIEIITPYYSSSVDPPIDGEKIKTYPCGTEIWKDKSHEFTIYHIVSSNYFSSPINMQIDVTLTKECFTSLVKFNEIVFDLLKENVIYCQILHCHSWYSALLPAYLKLSSSEQLHSIPCLLTLYNANEDGCFDPALFNLTNLPSYICDDTGFKEQTIGSLLKGGLIFSDALSLTSEHYVKDVQSSNFPLGYLFSQKHEKLHGILSGINYTHFEPEKDPHLIAPFSLANLDTKKECKRDLYTQLDISSDRLLLPVIGMLLPPKNKNTDYKIIYSLILKLLDLDIQIILITPDDTTSDWLLSTFEITSDNHMKTISLHTKTSLLHKLLGGLDMLIVTQRNITTLTFPLLALRYGVIPIIYPTGNLADTITPFELTEKSGNGFVYIDFSEPAIISQVLNAVGIFNSPENWRILIENAIKTDIQWSRTAQKYLHLYKSLI